MKTQIFNSFAAKKLKDAKVIDLWFDAVYEEEKQERAFVIRCKDGSFDLIVSKNGILYPPDSAYLNIEDLKHFCGIKLLQKNSLQESGYNCRAITMDLGCKKEANMDDIRAALKYHNEISK